MATNVVKKKSSKTKDLAKKVSTELEVKKSNNIPYSNDDYLIIRDDRGRLRIGSVVCKKRLLLEDGIEHDDTMQQIDFLNKNVVANLGKTPMNGKAVYGLTVSPFTGSEKQKGFGQINYYYDVDGDDKKRLSKALSSAWKVLKTNKCIASFPMYAIKIAKPSGKSNGTYKRVKANGDYRQSMSLNIVDFKDKDHLAQVIFGVTARAVWINQVPEDLQMAWTKLFHKHLILKTITEKQLKEILDSINTFAQDTENGDITAYKKSVCDDEDKIILNAILRHIRTVHLLDAKQLDRFVMVDPEFLESVWPTQIDLSRSKSSVSLAAEKSVLDMFCESFALQMRGAELPKPFRKLMKKTLAGLDKKFGE